MDMSRSLSLGLSPSGNTHPEIPAALIMSRDQELAVDRIPYEQLERRHIFKQLTISDVKDRLVVIKEMAQILPKENGPGNRPHRPEIKVLDGHGGVHTFILAKRSGPSEKPTFLPADWTKFMRERDAKPGDCIYFWLEVNKEMGTDYRINLFPFIHFVSPEAEGLGDSKNGAT